MLIHSDMFVRGKPLQIFLFQAFVKLGIFFFFRLSEFFYPLLGRDRFRGRCWAAIWLFHRPEPSGRAVHGEVDGLDIGGPSGGFRVGEARGKSKKGGSPMTSSYSANRENNFWSSLRYGHSRIRSWGYGITDLAEGEMQKRVHDTQFWKHWKLGRHG